MLNIVVVSWVLYTTVVWLLLLVGNRTDMQEALLNHKSAATVDWYVLMLCLSTHAIALSQLLQSLYHIVANFQGHKFS